MELRHLIYFKTVAEELHFRKAATRLCISQPPLSRQIRELEEELGAKLFDRNNKRVVLTEAGKYLKKEAEKILAQLEETKHITKQIHEGVSGKLRIGYIGSTYHINLVNVLKKIPYIFPFVKTKLYEVTTSKQIKALEEGKLDVGILRTPVDSEKLKIIPLFRDPFVLVVAKAENNIFNSADLQSTLADKHFIFFNKEYAPDYHQKLLQICHRLGFSPDVAHEVNNVHSILRLVESGLGVSIVPRSLKHQYSYLNIEFIELPEMPVYTEVVAAFRSEYLHPAAKWFLEKYCEIF